MLPSFRGTIILGLVRYDITGLNTIKMLHQIQVFLQERIRLVRPERIGDLELNSALIFHLQQALLQRRKSLMQIFHFQTKVQGLPHLGRGLSFGPGIGH